VQTNTYDPRRHGATPSLLSCHQAVDVSRLASRAPFFDRLRSNKNREEHHKSRFDAGFMRSMSRLLGVACAPEAIETDIRSCHGCAGHLLKDSGR